MPLLSVIIPVYNESGNIGSLVQAVQHALVSVDYELLVVDDGSTDNTVAEALAALPANGRVIALATNYGQSTALRAGIEAAAGKYIAILDGDGQNDPQDLPTMLQQLQRSGADMISGNRKKRKDAWLLRKLPSQFGNFLVRWASLVRIPDFGCSIRVMKQSVARDLRLYGHMHRYIPALAAANGADIISTPVQHHPRLQGKSNYGLERVGEVLRDLPLLAALSTRIPGHREKRIGTRLVLLVIPAILFGIALPLTRHHPATYSLLKYILIGWLLLYAVLGTLFLIAGARALNRHQLRAAESIYRTREVHTKENSGENSAV